MSRHDARHNILEGLDLREAILDIQSALSGWHWVLVGGLAVAYHANPPVTVDIDILVDVGRRHEYALRERMKGWSARRLWFPSSVMRGLPKHGLQFSHSRGFQAQCDMLFSGTDRYLQSIVARGTAANLPGKIRVITPEDLIVMKSLVGRDKDYEDVQAIVECMGDRIDQSYVERILRRLA